MQGEFIAFWLVDDRVVAGMNFNVWDVNDAIRELIRARAGRSTGAASPTPISRSRRPSRFEPVMRAENGDGSDEPP